MEGRIIARGVLAGALGGLLAFVFARIFAEPVISRAIDYESARDEAKASVMHMHMEDGPDIFSRTIQANIGIGVGIIAVGCAMGALFAVVYCVAAPHVARMEPRRLALAIAASMFVGVYLLPYLKYPANPPAIGNPDTIKERGGLYLLMVAISVALVWIAWIAGLTLAPRIGAWYATVAGGAVAVVGWGVAALLLPTFGSLAGNPPGSVTETPKPLTDSAGHVLFAGFDADDLFSFRLYSVGAQVILWLVIGLAGGELISRLAERSRARALAPSV